MPVHANYNSDAKARELREAVRRMIPAQVEYLVGIPSNADVMPAAILALRPKKVLALGTKGLKSELLDDLERWIAEWPLSGPKPRVVRVHRELTDEEILSTLGAEIRDARKAAVLVTGGTKPHTALLTRYAQAAGSLVVHVAVDYVQQKPVPGTGTVEILPVPKDVIRREALMQSRVFLRDRSFGAASHVLSALASTPDGAPDRDLLVELTQRWIEACRCRDAMLFAEARQRARSLVATIDGLGRPVNQAATHLALREAAGRLEEICTELEDAVATGGTWSNTARTPLLVELLLRGNQEAAGGRRNHAALLYYRVIELCLSERLRVHWRIDPSEATTDPAERFPNTGPPADAANLVQAFGDVSRQLGAPELDLRRKMGLVAQLAYLMARDDPALPANAMALAKTLRQWTTQRNASIFAHGLQPVQPGALEQVRELLREKDPQNGLLNLIAPDGPARGELNQKLARYAGPVLHEDGESVEGR